MIIRTLCPLAGSLPRDLRLFVRDLGSCTDIENHHDITSDDILDIHYLLRGKHVSRTIDVGLENHPLFLYLPQSRQTEHLKAPAVGEDVVIPVAETMEPSELPEYVNSRSQIQMVGVGKDEVVADLVHMLMIDTLYGSIGSHRHERRGYHIPVIEAEYAGTGTCRGMSMCYSVYLLHGLFPSYDKYP